MAGKTGAAHNLSRYRKKEITALKIMQKSVKTLDINIILL